MFSEELLLVPTKFLIYLAQILFNVLQREFWALKTLEAIELQGCFVYILLGWTYTGEHVIDKLFIRVYI
jgi:hypothetical protein